MKTGFPSEEDSNVASVPSYVKFAEDNTAELPFPVITAFDVKVETPVPPLPTDKSVPDQSPLFIARVP